MTDITLILDHHDDTCQVLLACGHWSGRIHVVSSTFDFPGDPLPCGNCGIERQLDLRLQVRIMEANDRDRS